MRREQVLQLLALLGLEGSGSGDWVQSRCPFATHKHQHGTDNNPSFGIKVGAASRYKCFSCNSSGSVSWLLLELKSLGYPFPVAEAMALAATEDTDDIMIDAPASYEGVSAPIARDRVWPEDFLKTFKGWSQVPLAIDYLSHRIPDPATCDFLDLRYDTQKERVCFPIRNWEGKLVGLHGRLVPNKPAPRYYAYRYQGEYHKTMWYGESWVDLQKPVVLVESVFDLAAVLPITRNVLSPLMAGISKDKAMRIQGATELVTLFDTDKAGDTARTAISHWLDWIPTYHLKLPGKYKDPGEAPPEVLVKKLKKFV